MSKEPPQDINAAFEDDPQGVRELLRGLPDPGPMPASVFDRINSALQAERAAPDDKIDASGIRELLQGLPDPGPMPAHVSKRVTVALEVARQERADEDPTGMRDLLRSLPDPGPMPQSVAASVQSALAREVDERGKAPSNVTPLRSRRSDTGGEQSQAKRRGMLRLVSGVAAAAVAGVIAVGAYQSMNNDAPPALGGGPSESSQSVSDKVHVTSTGKNYTTATFAKDAAALGASDTDRGISPADQAVLGNVATPSGAMQCAKAIGDDVLNGASKITVDIAKYNGQPALVVVVADHGKSTAWVLNRSCDKAQAPVVGPVTV